MSPSSDRALIHGPRPTSKEIEAALGGPPLRPPQFIPGTPPPAGQPQFPPAGMPPVAPPQEDPLQTIRRVDATPAAPAAPPPAKPTRTALWNAGQLPPALRSDVERVRLRLDALLAAMEQAEEIEKEVAKLMGATVAHGLDGIPDFDLPAALSFCAGVAALLPPK